MASAKSVVPPAVDAALGQVPLPMAAVQPSTGRTLAANQAFHALFGERSMDEIAPADDRDEAREALQFLATHRLEGYRRHGRFITEDGRQLPGQICVQTLDVGDTHDLAIAVILPAEHEGVELPPWTRLAGDVVELGVIVTDHDWRIEHISNNVHALLGYDPPSLVGTALLGLVHPDDALKFLEATAGSVTARQTAVARVRLRAADGCWRELGCLITPLCGHRPPRLTVLLSAPGSGPVTTEATRAEELEQHLWRIAMEVRAAGLVPDVRNLLPVDRTREFSELSGRQWEIVTRLVNGQRVPEIARSMYLSQSTVRNHLTLVFRKFGVHSQRELLDLFSSAARPAV